MHFQTYCIFFGVRRSFVAVVAPFPCRPNEFITQSAALPPLYVLSPLPTTHLPVSFDLICNHFGHNFLLPAPIRTSASSADHKVT